MADDRGNAQSAQALGFSQTWKNLWLSFVKRHLEQNMHWKSHQLSHVGLIMFGSRDE